MSPLVTPIMFSYKYIEKQLYKLGVSDTASWLNSPLPGLLRSTLACGKIAQILLTRNHSYTGDFLLRFSHTSHSARHRATKFNVSKLKNFLKKMRQTFD